MLQKPSGCTDCKLFSSSSGFSSVSGPLNSGAIFVSGPLSPTELETGNVFSGSSGILLDRTLSRGGIRLRDYNIQAAVKCCPADDTLTSDIVKYCYSKHGWTGEAIAGQNKVIIAMGQEALVALTGTDQDILDMRGYAIWDSQRNCWIMPTVHPDFVKMGHSDFAPVVLNDVRNALVLRGKLPEQVHPVKNYLIDPDERQFLEWVARYNVAYSNNPAIKLAFDIETPWKHDEDEEESDFDDLRDDQKRRIDRISFSYKPHTGISFPYKWE
jgi:uracil-DNA glycosylase family 4